MDVRRFIAGRLIRLAHKVYPPKVRVQYSGQLAATGVNGLMAHRDLARAEAALTEARNR